MVVGTNCARTTLLASRNNNLNLTHINRPKGSLGVAYPCWTGRSSSLRRRVVLAKVAQPLSDTTVVAESQPTADEALQQQLEQLHVLASIDDVPVEVPPDVLAEFEHKLEEDLTSVAVTLTAVTGVIIFWRGVWSLLDYVLGDSIFGDICCIIVGLTIVTGIRLSGVRVSSSFWPPS